MMRQGRVAAISSIAGLALVLLLAAFAWANQSGRGTTILATGTLRDQGSTISIPTVLSFLSLLDANNGKQQSGAGGINTTKQLATAQNSKVSINQLRQPAGVVAQVCVRPGDTVKNGDVLFIIDDEEAKANFDLSQAKYDLVAATIEKLTGTRSDLSDKAHQLNETEADLRIKSTEAASQFNSKYREGQDKVNGLKTNLATVATNLNAAQTGLALANKAEVEARHKLEVAESLPDSNSGKQQKIAQINAVLQGIRQKKSQLGAAIIQLSTAQSKLQNGIAIASQSLAKGEAQYAAGIKNIEDALKGIDDGRKQLQEGSSSVSKNIAILSKRRDQADVAVSIAKQVINATAVRATSSGVVKNLKIGEGSTVYAGQPVVLIARSALLSLDIFVPVLEVNKIKLGNPVDVEVDAMPGTVFKGKVVAIAGKAGFAPSNMATQELELLRVVKVVVEVANKDDILKAGMPADVTIR